MLYELPAAELDELKSAIAASPIVSGPSWLEMRLAIGRTPAFRPMLTRSSSSGW